MNPFFQKKTYWIDPPPFARNGGVSRGRSVTVAVGCWHFLGTSMALQWQKTLLQKGIFLFFFGINGATIRIGQEIQCLPLCWTFSFLLKF